MLQADLPCPTAGIAPTQGGGMAESGVMSGINIADCSYNSSSCIWPRPPRSEPCVRTSSVDTSAAALQNTPLELITHMKYSMN